MTWQDADVPNADVSPNQAQLYRSLQHQDSMTYWIIVTHMKIGAKPGNFIGFSYIGHSDLHITYYGLLHVWYVTHKEFE